MDQKGRGRGRGGGGGAGGRGGGDSSHTDLLAAGRKKLQQFRKKKDKKGPGKKAEADAEGASQPGANRDDAAPEPRSPVGLKFLAGEGGSSSTPFEEAARAQEERCNGEGPATTEPTAAAENADAVPMPEDADGTTVQSAAENADAVPVPEDADGASVLNVGGIGGNLFSSSRKPSGHDQKSTKSSVVAAVANPRPGGFWSPSRHPAREENHHRGSTSPCPPPV